jgi:hypothetical protein
LSIGGLIFPVLPMLAPAPEIEHVVFQKFPQIGILLAESAGGVAQLFGIYHE